VTKLGVSYLLMTWSKERGKKLSDEWTQTVFVKYERKWI
jgi:hypothetical protein